MTKESVFGELTGGHVFDCPQSMCRRLVGAECAILDALVALTDTVKQLAVDATLVEGGVAFDDRLRGASGRLTALL